MLKSINISKKWLAVVGALGCLAVSYIPAAQAQEEAKVYAVTTWNGGCSGSTRTWWDDMANAWYDEVTDSGFSIFGWCITGHCGKAYSRDGRTVDGNIVNSLFADSGVVGWGRDSSNLDEGDAALVAWHGSESGNVYQGSLRVNEAGDGDCTLRQDEMRLGNDDLEFLHLSSCQSMDDNQWGTWWRAFSGIHQVDGFHGLMWIGSGMVDDYEDFADDAFDTSIAEAWLDNLYIRRVSGNDDQCPVAYGVGSTVSDLWNRMNHERYDYVMSDPVTFNYWGAIYITGCDPANETVVGSDSSQ